MEPHQSALLDPQHTWILTIKHSWNLTNKDTLCSTSQWILILLLAAEETPTHVLWTHFNPSVTASIPFTSWLDPHSHREHIVLLVSVASVITMTIIPLYQSSPVVIVPLSLCPVILPRSSPNIYPGPQFPKYVLPDPHQLPCHWTPVFVFLLMKGSVCLGDNVRCTLLIPSMLQIKIK